MKQTSFFALCLAVLVFSCNQADKKSTDTTMNKKGTSKSAFGNVDGKEVSLYTLTNANGDQVKITNYGGIVTAWISNDKAGNKSSIVIGFDSLAPYLRQPPYFGALIGRYGNRIANAKFTLDSVEYKLAANDGKNHLHGGKTGFDKVVWDAAVPSDSLAMLVLKYTSKNGEEGYPGNLIVNVRYSLTDDNELQIEYDAVTDKYTPVDTTLIPTGQILPVENTPFDFTVATKIGARIAQVPGKAPGGYDHNWVLRRSGTGMEKIAELRDSVSGRTLAVYTTEPGLQFYSGNFLDGKFKDKQGKPYNIHAALCLETQHFPDSPNEPSFPTTVLRPGEKYHTTTTYKLSVQ